MTESQARTYIGCLSKEEKLQLLVFLDRLESRREPSASLRAETEWEILSLDQETAAEVLAILQDQRIIHGGNTMKNEMQIFNSPEFGQVRTIDENGKVLFCGADVAKALGYSKPQNAIAQHCKGALKRGILTSGGKQMMLFIPEGDIYRLAASSQLPGAEKFESWIFDEVLPSIRKTGSYTAKPMTDYQLESIRIRKAQLLERLAKEYDGTYRQVLQAHATKELTGEYLLPLPRLPSRTYTAQEIGDQLGISANKVGQLANRHHLKTEQYGGWVNDVAKNCPGKEVPSFRYYESVVPVLRSLLSQFT